MTERQENQPYIAVIVPVTGESPELQKNLRSIAEQHYPHYQLFLVTQDDQDAAVSAIRKVAAGAKGTIKHVIAGTSRSCSQKNLNLLQGVAAVDSSADILVFCDAGHYVPPYWLARLIEPLLADRTSAVSSGYHIVLPEKYSLTAIGRAATVFFISLFRRIPGCAQPWGGATAMYATTFGRLEVEKLWSTTIVDDVTLAAHLSKMKEKVAIPSGADVYTTISDHSWSAWSAWFVRQWAYVKFVFPFLWLFSGIAVVLWTLLIIVTILITATGGFGVLSSHVVLRWAIFLGVVMSILLYIRAQHPSPGALILWFPALLAALIVASTSYISTWFTDTLCWAGIVYKVGKGGQVTEIHRPLAKNSMECHP